MDFDDVDATKIDDRVFRLLAPPTLDDALAALGTSPRNARAIEAFLNSTPARALTTNDIAFAFEPPFRVGRFSDGQHGVFYTALEEETAISELRHHVVKRLQAKLSNEAHYVVMSFRVFGNGKDLRPVQAQMPYLADQNENSAYPLCQALARRAIAHALDLFITPSARRAAGSCAPVFSSTSVDVSSAENIGAVVFSVDKLSQLADVRWV